MTVNLNEPYNEYQWSIIPMMDQDLVMVIGEQNLERKVTVAYNFKNAEVKAAVLETAAWGAEQCAGLGDLFYHLYVDESVIPEALNNVNLALGDHLATLSYCTIFEPLGPISLSYGSNSDQLVAQFTKIGGTDSGQLVYDKNSGRYLINSAADQLGLRNRSGMSLSITSCFMISRRFSRIPRARCWKTDGSAVREASVLCRWVRSKSRR